MGSKTLLLFPLLVLTLAGCAAKINRSMDVWIGRPVSSLVATWGPPTQTLPAENGGSILIYKHVVNYVVKPETTTTTGSVNNKNIDNVQLKTVTTPAETTTSVSDRTFYINADGVVTKYSWHGGY